MRSVHDADARPPSAAAASEHASTTDATSKPRIAPRLPRPRLSSRPKHAFQARHLITGQGTLRRSSCRVAAGPRPPRNVGWQVFELATSPARRILDRSASDLVAASTRNRRPANAAARIGSRGSRVGREGWSCHPARSISSGSGCNPSRPTARRTGSSTSATSASSGVALTSRRMVFESRHRGRPRRRRAAGAHQEDRRLPRRRGIAAWLTRVEVRLT